MNLRGLRRLGLDRFARFRHHVEILAYALKVSVAPPRRMLAEVVAQAERAVSTGHHPEPSGRIVLTPGTDTVSALDNARALS